jgi:hypothetical protein
MYSDPLFESSIDLTAMRSIAEGSWARAWRRLQEDHVINVMLELILLHPAVNRAKQP